MAAEVILRQNEMNKVAELSEIDSDEMKKNSHGKLQVVLDYCEEILDFFTEPKNAIISPALHSHLSFNLLKFLV